LLKSLTRNINLKKATVVFLQYFLKRRELLCAHGVGEASTKGNTDSCQSCQTNTRECQGRRRKQTTACERAMRRRWSVWACTQTIAKHGEETTRAGAKGMLYAIRCYFLFFGDNP